jgi:hypothetical protein
MIAAEVGLRMALVLAGERARVRAVIGGGSRLEED